MSKIDELKAEIERLPSEKFAELFRWLSEKDWEKWDKEIEADSQSDRLDLLAHEAREEKATGECLDPFPGGEISGPLVPIADDHRQS